MPQVQVFQCPSCGANLQYDGGSEISFPCQFCGTTVIVPEELRSGAPEPGSITAGRPGSSKKPGPELTGSIDEKIKKEVAQVVSSGRLDDPELLELVQLEMTELINEAIESADDARAAQLHHLLQLTSSGKKPEAVDLFRQAFPSMSATEGEQAVNILASGSAG